MVGKYGDTFRAKKPAKPTVRKMTSGLFLLRAAELGIRIEDLVYYTIGDIFDMVIERGNDHEEYPQEATSADIKRLFGGA